jgi:hypothetical protein
MMTKERAYAINSAICNMGMLTVLGFDSCKPDIALLRSLELREMLDAVDFVKLDNDTKPAVDGKRSFSLVPDPRLTAAVYTLLHYSVGPHEADDLVAGYADGGRVHLLITGVRDRAEIEHEDEEDEAA